MVESKWSIKILSSLSEESPQNFSTVQEQFDTSNDVITDRLRLLAEYDLIDRREHTRRDVRYSITKRGERFLDELRDLNSLLRKGL
ncbi:winged helix-turn-helix transcriptional regulator [Halomicroarcula limicola]|uniref:Winged helix-turn-helix transcriptional regulator n=1 Tax=Haloarcula limicola TaxID=1429915 RepID=A0A8J7YCJ3_9EURY|nr:winged helix-turn-helix transcriptional regulator [Halomicroarcula limicola]